MNFTVPTQTTYAGHTLRQIWRENDVAVYARSIKPDAKPHELEMIFIQTRPDKVMPSGNFVPRHEAFPTPSQWGTFGFSFPIRYHDMVLALAEECSKTSKGRRALVIKHRSQMDMNFTLTTQNCAELVQTTVGPSPIPIRRPK